MLIFVYIHICYTVFLTSSSLLPLHAGSDFEVVSREVIIPPGVTSITVSIIINDDAIVEGNEDFLVAFTIIDNMEGGVVTTITGTDTSTTVVTIQDNDSESQYKISRGCSTLSLYNGLPASYHYNCKPVGTLFPAQYYCMYVHVSLMGCLVALLATLGLSIVAMHYNIHRQTHFQLVHLDQLVNMQRFTLARLACPPGVQYVVVWLGNAAQTGVVLPAKLQVFCFILCRTDSRV